ncbi:MAG: GNAT family N-acetyltransferase [Candidatus Bathyarchaeia archaeon]
MIRKLPPSEFNSILHVVNEAASAYEGVIPPDRWKEPYMSAEELREESESGVQFYGLEENGALLAVMGIQRVRDVTLIRHAYVLSRHQRRGLGRKLLEHLLSLAETPLILVGTWEAAWWAVRFYEKNGFRLVSWEEKNRLLREYWNIPERQVETSVVLKLRK